MSSWHHSALAPPSKSLFAMADAHLQVIIPVLGLMYPFIPATPRKAPTTLPGAILGPGHTGGKTPSLSLASESF